MKLFTLVIIIFLFWIGSCINNSKIYQSQNYETQYHDSGNRESQNEFEKMVITNTENEIVQETKFSTTEHIINPGEYNVKDLLREKKTTIESKIQDQKVKSCSSKMVLEQLLPSSGKAKVTHNVFALGWCFSRKAVVMLETAPVVTQYINEKKLGFILMSYVPGKISITVKTHGKYTQTLYFIVTP